MKPFDVAFYALALFILANGWLVLKSRNIIHSAYCLILCFLGVAGIYALLGSGFIALAQVLIYAGAISVLLLFAIMTVLKPDAEGTNPSHSVRWGAALIIGLLTVISLLVIWKSMPAIAPVTAAVNNVPALGDLLMGAYAVPLEVAALLLLVALAGAIILVKGAEDR